MEGILYLVAEGISLREMRALQRACMLFSVKAREKEYEEFLFDRMATIPDGKRREPSHVIHVEVKRCDLKIAARCCAKTMKSKEG